MYLTFDLTLSAACPERRHVLHCRWLRVSGPLPDPHAEEGDALALLLSSDALQQGKKSV